MRKRCQLINVDVDVDVVIRSVFCTESSVASVHLHDSCNVSS